MDGYGRRNRKGRCRSHQNRPPPVHVYTPPNEAKPWSFLSGVYSLLIMSSLIAICYLMLEHHCETCRAHYDMNELNTNIDHIANNLTVILRNYHDLEAKISKLSQDLPKIEGQMEILGALTNNIDNRHDIMPINIPNIDDLFNNKVIDAKIETEKTFVPKTIQVGAD